MGVNLQLYRLLGPSGRKVLFVAVAELSGSIDQCGRCSSPPTSSHLNGRSTSRPSLVRRGGTTVANLKLPAVGCCRGDRRPILHTSSRKATVALLQASPTNDLALFNQAVGDSVGCLGR